MLGVHVVHACVCVYVGAGGRTYVCDCVGACACVSVDMGVGVVDGVIDTFT